MTNLKNRIRRRSNEVIDTNEKEYHFSGRIKAALATTATAGTVLAIGSTEKAQELVDTAEFIPTPDVSTAGTDTLIAVNDIMLNYGPLAFTTGATALAAYSIIKRKNPEGQLRAMHDITHQASRKKGIIMVAATAGIVASAAGLGNTAGEGANEPVQAMSQMLSADSETTPIITSYANIPFNPTGIDYQSIAPIVTREGGAPIPFLQVLGEVRNPDADSNPSSAPIFALPNDLIKHSLGVSMPEVVSCGDMSVIVGKQLGAEPGDKITINDLPATVAGTVDVKPGLDRVAAIGSLEQISNCVYPNMPMTGIVALGLEGQQEQLQEKLQSTLNSPLVARSFEEFEEEYKEFWDRSVKPPEMMLIMSVLALGSLGISGTQINETLNRRKNIAMYISQGMEKKDISRAYTIASHRDAIIAGGLATVPATALVALNNSSQFGLAEAVNPSIIGAGYSAVFIATIFSTIANKRVINNIDVAKELRGTA